MRGAMVLVLGLPLMFACESDSFKPEPFNDPQLLWSLNLNHHAAILSMASTYDTLRLMATPRNYQGQSLAGLPAVQYVSRDPSKVVVTNAGLLVAITPIVQPIWVVATLTMGNLKQSDSMLVRVVNVNPPPVLDTFSVHPLPPDSAKLATKSYYFHTQGLIGYPKDTLFPRLVDPNGASLETLPGIGKIPVHFRSSDPTIAKINPVNGEIEGMKPGTVTLYASTTAFGVTKEDTLPYRIGHQIQVSSTIEFSPTKNIRFKEPEFQVGVGATVVWYSRLTVGDVLSTLYLLDFNYSFGLDLGVLHFLEADITFNEDDLPHITASNIVKAADNTLLCIQEPKFSDCTNTGNILLGSGGVYHPTLFPAPPYPLEWAARKFTAPGTYEFRSVMHGVSGRIIVVDERE